MANVIAIETPQTHRRLTVLPCDNVRTPRTSDTLASRRCNAGCRKALRTAPVDLRCRHWARP
jgi:hypothetical protein